MIFWDGSINVICTHALSSSGLLHPGGRFLILEFAAPLQFLRNLHVCSVRVHIRCLLLVNKPLVFHFRASVCTSRLYILSRHNFVILLVVLSSPGLIGFFSTLRVLSWRFAVSCFSQFSDVDYSIKQ